MLAKPATCKGCPLYLDGEGFSTLRGKGEEGVLLVGEALGEEEAKAGQPFVGKTGQFLQRIISRTHDPEHGRVLDMDRDFYISNTIRCRPPNNRPPTEEEIDKCRIYLKSTISQTKPKVIVAVGGVAFRALTGQHSIDKYRGYLFQSEWGIPVIGTYHPSYLVRGKIYLSRVVQLDLLKALSVARHGAPERRVNYILHPDPQDFLEFIEEYEATPGATLAFDIETPYAKGAEKDEEVWDEAIEDNQTYTILRCSFAFKEHHAISIPWMEPFTSGARRLLSGLGRKTVWHGNYDIPRLEAAGAPINGPVVDAMHAWKCLEPALPMGLKFVATLLCPDVEAWKLKSADEPEYYSAADSDILLRCLVKIEAKLKEQNRWEMFQKHFVELSGVLTKMSRRGVRVNQPARLAARERFQTWLDSLSQALQPLIPDSLKPKKVFKLPLETLLKKGLTREELILVSDEIGELKKGWMLSPERYLVREPKPAKVKRQSKPTGKRKKSTKPAPSAEDQTPQG